MYVTTEQWAARYFRLWLSEQDLQEAFRDAWSKPYVVFPADSADSKPR